MGSLPRLVEWLWALSVMAQILLFTLLCVRGHFRRFPAFTAYIVLNLCQAFFLVLVYLKVGFAWQTGGLIAWATQAAILGVKALVVGEVCRVVLRPYRGIWALTRWLLSGAAAAVVVYTAADAGQDLALAVLTVDRGLELAIAVALVSLLLLVRYYAIPIAHAPKAIAVGFCLYSCFVVLNRSVLERWLMAYDRYWNGLELPVFILIVLMWSAALRHPVPAREGEPVLLPPSVSNELSPHIDARLRMLSEKLTEMLRT